MRCTRKRTTAQTLFSQYHGQTYSFFSNRFSSVRDAVTLRAVGYYQDPIACKVSAKTDSQMVRYWPLWALTGLVSAQHGQTSFPFFRTASRPFAAPILCIWSDTITIRAHAKYRPKRSSFWQRFGHLVRPQLPGSAQNDQTLYSFFPNGFPAVRGADTLHVVGSCHDPTPCQVTAETDCRMVSYWPSCAPPVAWERTTK